jgi:hypothetical protein
MSLKSIPRPIPMPRALENASLEANLLAKKLIAFCVNFS